MVAGHYQKKKKKKKMGVGLIMGGPLVTLLYMRKRSRDLCVGLSPCMKRLGIGRWRVPDPDPAPVALSSADEDAVLGADSSSPMLQKWLEAGEARVAMKESTVRLFTKSRDE
jgi:hypothetical protein